MLHPKGGGEINSNYSILTILLAEILNLQEYVSLKTTGQLLCMFMKLHTKLGD